MEALERITKDTCANKLRVERSAYVSEEDERCKQCQSYQERNGCQNYRPYNNTFPIRFGRLGLIAKRK